MRMLAALVLAAPVTALVLAQDNTSDPAVIASAEAVLTDVARAYREAPTLTDEMSVSLETPQGAQTYEIGLVFDRDDAMRMRLPDRSMTSVEGTVYVVRDDVPLKYARFEVEKDSTAALKRGLTESYGDGGGLPVQVLMRGGREISDVIGAMGMGILEDPSITGYRKADVDGRPVHEIDFSDGAGNATLTVDDATRLITGMTLTATPPGAPEGFTIDVTVGFAPTVQDALGEAVAFEPGTRTLVDAIDKLEPTPIAAGDPVPDFTLSMLGGEPVTLSALKGNVVVLDFWATWCGPCRRGLPLLQEFATWAESSKQPVKVFAVDVWERGHASDAELDTKVTEFWTAQKFTMPTLMDYQNQVAAMFGFQSIPTTVIVGPDGNVHAIHTGFSKDMVDQLKSDVEKALQGAG